MSSGPPGVALGVALTLSALTLAGCGADRQDAIDELVAAGYEPESAECIMTELEARGHEAADLTDPLAAEVEIAIEAAVTRCLTAADLSGIGGEIGGQIGEDQLRLDVIDGLVSSGLEPATAECIVDHVVASGFTMIDLAKAGFEMQTEGGVIDAVTVGAEACAGG